MLYKYVIICYYVLLYVIICYYMLLYVIICYYMLLYVIICYYMFLFISISMGFSSHVWWPEGIYILIKQLTKCSEPWKLLQTREERAGAMVSLQPGRDSVSCSQRFKWIQYKTSHKWSELCGKSLLNHGSRGVFNIRGKEIHWNIVFFYTMQISACKMD